MSCNLDLSHFVENIVAKVSKNNVPSDISTKWGVSKMCSFGFYE